MPGGLRQRFESGLGGDLSGLRLHRCRGAAAALAGLGARACAVDGTVLLGAGPVPWRVLAHEAAHALQQRRRGPAAPAWQLEAEAHRAGDTVLRGLRAPVTLAADRSIPLPWEEAGHYYTVYFVGLACGLDDLRAHRNAFWAQFPDEVSELDAVGAGLDIPVSWASRIINAPGEAYDSFRDHLADFGTNLSAEMLDWMRVPGSRSRGTQYATRQHDASLRRYHQNFDIQMGLHCLTGVDWDIETPRRRRISPDARREPGDFEFGLSLHAYGDSFAHRNPRTHKMFAPFIGHGGDSIAAEHGGAAAEAMNFRDPDSLATHNRDKYRAYVIGLHGIISTRWDEAEAILDAGATANRLGTLISDAPNSGRQITQIRGLAGSALRRRMNAYAPEGRGKVLFRNFRAPNSPVVASDLHLTNALYFAQAWAHT